MKKIILLIILVVNALATNILLLNSYRADLEWTQDQYLTIIQTLKKSNIKNIQLHVEFMDTKFFRPTPETMNNSFLYYKNKYNKTKFDIIITTDDNALNFVRKFKQKKLFKDVKVFFSGVNNLSLKDKLDKNIYAGVFERKNPIANINLARNINPNIKKVYLIFDETITSSKIIKEYKKEYKDIKDIEFVYINNKNIEDTLKILKNYEKNSISMLLVFTGFFKYANHISAQEAHKDIISVYKNPILIHTNTYLQYDNIIGGNCVSGKEQGKQVALKVIKYLAGNDLKTIGFMLKSPNACYINMKNVLNYDLDVGKFNIKKPILVNKPISFYDLYSSWVHLFIVIVSIIVFFLIIVVKKNQQLKNKIKEIKSINKTLDSKEIQLIKQSKMASMGSMIENITHQWRQPLSTISTTASGVTVMHELDTLEYDKIPEHMNTIVEKTKYLSEIINTFRNFMMEDKIFKDVVIQERIDISLEIANVLLKDNKIELRNTINYANPIKIRLVIGELAEVLINIINNANDILIENKIQNPYVSIGLEEKENKVIITIEDNGGGIPQEIIEKIFDEHFTTKSEDVGTGIGLYMSYKIVTNSLQGNLYVENTKDGAKFFIELPLDKGQ